MPTFTTPLELLEYALCNMDILDLLRPSDDPTRLVLCTMFVDRVPRKNTVDTHGVTLTLVRTTDTTVRIEELEHGGRSYSRDTIPPAIASRALWGIVSYITTATHLFMLHGQCGALLADISERRLDRTHPLRCILLPTELGTPEGS